MTLTETKSGKQTSTIVEVLSNLPKAIVGTGGFQYRLEDFRSSWQGSAILTITNITLNLISVTADSLLYSGSTTAWDYAGFFYPPSRCENKAGASISVRIILNPSTRTYELNTSFPYSWTNSCDTANAYSGSSTHPYGYPGYPSVFTLQGAVTQTQGQLVLNEGTGTVQDLDFGGNTQRLTTFGTWKSQDP
jgi:hypothetical protein